MMSKEKMICERKNGIVLLVIIMFISIPLFYGKIYDGHDLDFHLQRINGIYHGLLDGKINTKIQPCWYDDYGYAVGIFYGDLFLYFPAALRCIGMSIVASYKCFVFAINVLTVLISNYCFSKIWGQRMGIIMSFCTQHTYIVWLMYT